MFECKWMRWSFQKISPTCSSPPSTLFPPPLQNEEMNATWSAMAFSYSPFLFVVNEWPEFPYTVHFTSHPSFSRWWRKSNASGVRMSFSPRVKNAFGKALIFGYIAAGTILKA